MHRHPASAGFPSNNLIPFCVDFRACSMLGMFSCFGSEWVIPAGKTCRRLPGICKKRIHWRNRGMGVLRRKAIIGLVGGIGSGKSTVARMLAEAGAAVIDADALAHDLLNRSDIVKQLRSWWGDSVFNEAGKIDRRKVGDLAFSDANQRRRLEELIHPHVCRERLRLIEQYESDARCRFIVLDSPLLLEAGLDRDCEAIVFVDSSDEVRKSRVQRTRGWQSSEWIAREKSQITLDKKRKKADYVVANNSSDLNELRLATGNLLESLKSTGIISA